MKRGSSGVTVGKDLPAKAGGRRDTGSIPRSGRFPGRGSDNSLQNSCLGNPMAGYSPLGPQRMGHN